MADDDYVRLSNACHCGVLLPKRLGRGRPQKFCDEHKGKQRQKFEPRKCLGCAAEFAPVKYDQIYCTTICGKRVRRGSKPADLAQEFNCLRCKTKFSTTAKTQSDYCSQFCRTKAWAKKNPGRWSAHQTKSAIVRQGRLKAATLELVDPFKVFRAAKWRCQICGVETPRSKRGSHAADAPELDHIHPLSKGGAHSYANTQCACRKCNGAKGNKLWQPRKPTTQTAQPVL